MFVHIFYARTRRACTIAMIAVWVGSGCAQTDSDPFLAAAPATWQSLVSPAAWQVATDASDPFGELRPAGTTCDPDGHGYEYLTGELVYEIDTGLCNYLSVSQSTLSAIHAGDLLRLRIWHDPLTRPPGDTGAEAAVGYIGIVIGETLLFEHSVPIPHQAQLIYREFESPIDAVLGTPVVFHVHNHGENTWSFVELSVLR